MQPRHRARLQTAARLGLAHWFFGNLYEEVVGMPARLAAQPSPSGPLASGSPVRYYLPVAPVTVAAVLACVAAGWGRRADRPALAAAGLLTATGAGLTAHLVRKVILRLLDDAARPTDPAEQQRLVRYWHRGKTASGWGSSPRPPSPCGPVRGTRSRGGADGRAARAAPTGRGCQRSWSDSLDKPPARTGL